MQNFENLSVTRINEESEYTVFYSQFYMHIIEVSDQVLNKLKRVIKTLLNIRNFFAKKPLFEKNSIIDIWYGSNCVLYKMQGLFRKLANCAGFLVKRIWLFWVWDLSSCDGVALSFSSCLRFCCLYWWIVVIIFIGVFWPFCLILNLKNTALANKIQILVTKI